MAKKNQAAKSDATRQKAIEMREAQRKADLRTRNIIIAIVTVVVIAIIGAIIAVVVNRPTAESAAQGLPEQFRAGEGITVSAGGVGVEDTSVPNLEMYFDYTCPGCVYLDTGIGDEMFADVEAGKYSVTLRPVKTHNAAFNAAATSASLAVAAAAPEQFVALHQALIAYYFEAMTDGDGSVVQDASASFDAVKQIAAAVGVPDDVISTFNVNSAESYLTQSSTDWVQADITRTGGAASPEVVIDGTSLDFADLSDGPANIALIRETLGVAQ